MTPKISIIIPIYNAEKTLHRCVDSILNQTFSDFEILLIDDGSPDACAMICDDYASKDDRIKSFHKPNGGVSSARQFGIERAMGEYSIHVDPDDWVESTMLQELYNCAVSNEADVVICDFFQDFHSHCIYQQEKPIGTTSCDMIHELFQQLHGCCWNKLVKQTCYNKYKIRFPENLNYGEDLIVVMQLFIQNLKVVYCPQAFYHYMMNENSITHTRHNSKKWINEDVLSINYMDALLKGKGYEEDLIRFKLKIKGIHIKDRFLTNKEFMSLFPETNKYIFSQYDESFFNKVLLWMTSYCRIKPFINILLNIKHTFKSHSKK